MLRFPALVFAVWLSAIGAVEAGCVVPRFSFHVNQTSDAHMHVTRGSACSINLQVGGRSHFSGIRISAQPKNGITIVRSVGVAYRPRPGFTGSDSFAFAVTGQLAGGAGTAVIRVNVTVQ